MVKPIQSSLWWDQSSGSAGSKHRLEVRPESVSGGHDRPVPSSPKATQACTRCTAIDRATCHVIQSWLVTRSVT